MTTTRTRRTTCCTTTTTTTASRISNNNNKNNINNKTKKKNRKKKNEDDDAVVLLQEHRHSFCSSSRRILLLNNQNSKRTTILPPTTILINIIIMLSLLLKNSSTTTSRSISSLLLLLQTKGTTTKKPWCSSSSFFVLGSSSFPCYYYPKKHAEEQRQPPPQLLARTISGGSSSSSSSSNNNFRQQQQQRQELFRSSSSSRISTTTTTSSAAFMTTMSRRNNNNNNIIARTSSSSSLTTKKATTITRTSMATTATISTRTRWPSSLLLLLSRSSSTTRSSRLTARLWASSTSSTPSQQTPEVDSSSSSDSTSTTSSTSTTTTKKVGKAEEEETVTKEETDSSSPVIKQLDIKYTMDDIISLCKRRGLIFISSEIYNGFAGFFDYGPTGCEIKKNIKDRWWKFFITKRDDIVGIDSSIIHNPIVWKSSGHIDGFSDPMIDCKISKLRYRADQLYFSEIKSAEKQNHDDDDNDNDNEILGYVTVMEGTDEDMIKDAKKQVKALLKELDRKGEKIQPFHFREVVEATEDEMKHIPSPATGKPGSLTMPRDFNLMFQTNVGALADESAVAYLRPETAQGIFINFKNTLGTSRQKIPFGIGQIGKAFRNEITPRNFIFRSREFEQMEIEYFIKPGDDIWPEYYNYWIQQSKEFLHSIGIRDDLMDIEIHKDDKLAHYALACTDITFQFPFGKQELMGIAARGNYDLTQHSEGSGKNLDYYDAELKEKYIPHCIEPSLGVDRLMLALICSAYHEDVIDNEKRSLLSFHPSIAPIKVAVLPLLKNKEQLVTVARNLYDKLKLRWNCQWDVSGAIGRRYRRADEIGIPYCITVDFDTIEKGDEQTVTIRDRDTTKQFRIPIKDVVTYLSKQIDGYE